MTLLRRAPREVYRVYGEEEFLASAGMEETFEDLADSRDRRMQRLAGATLLVAITGVAGGLVVVTSLPSAAGGTRRAAGLLAVAGAVVRGRAAHAHAWRTSAAAAVRVNLPAPAGTQRLIPRQLVARSEPVGGALATRPVPASRRVFVSAQSRTAARLEPATQPQPATQTAAASQPAAPRQPEPSEFGFER